MKNEDKTKKQLLKELMALGQRISELELSEVRLKETEKALQESLEFTESLIEGIAEPVTVINSNCEIAWMNRAAHQFMFGDAQKVKSLFCYECHHKKETRCDGVEFDCPMKIGCESREPMRVVHEHFRSDGEKRFLEITSSPLWNKEGIFQGIIEIARDVTEHRRFDEEREKLMDKLQKSLSEIKILRGMIPICAWCRRVRDDDGFWKKVEEYVSEHTEAEFSHGICPECMKEVERNKK